MTKKQLSAVEDDLSNSQIGKVALTSQLSAAELATTIFHHRIRGQGCSRAHLDPTWLNRAGAEITSSVLTWMSTPGWLSEYVVKTCCCLVGMVVFLLIRAVITPPAVSIPRDNGATSRSRRSWTCHDLKFISNDDRFYWARPPHEKSTSLNK